MIFWVSLLRLPATFLHELMHFLVAIIFMCKVTGFSLIPKVQGDKIVLGNVSVIPPFKGVLIFVGLAPFLLWLSAFYIWYKNIILISKEFTFVLVIYMLLGGIPSYQDIKISLEGLFSFSGIVLLSVIVLVLHKIFS